jgi:ferredoxin
MMRFDIFLPSLRKPKRGAEPEPDGWLLRTAKHLLPSSLFADKKTGEPGRVRRWLKRIGPTVLSSPIRRLVQGVCFITFLALFFYVCWPYTARPVPSLISNGWVTANLDLQTVRLVLTKSGEPDEAVRQGQEIHLVDADKPSATDGYVAPFHVVRRDGGRLTLKPAGELTEEAIDRLIGASGTWSLHRSHPWPSHYADDLRTKQLLPAESFLAIDPLVAISTTIATRSWVWSLTCAAIILVVCTAVPRGFCGYLCPLGTLIDLFDWAITSRVRRFRVGPDGWWVHVKYYLLMATLIAAGCGVLVSGYVAAIPVITRGLMFLAAPLQTGFLRSWHQVPPFNAGHIVSIVLFLAVLCLGFLKPRFWCKYVCPSGAVFSLGNLFRVSERKVESTCIHCNQCIEICPFDAIKPDFTTRTTDCTLCQTCGGVCPTHAIKFVERWNSVDLKAVNDPPTSETPLGRRGFLSLAAGSAAALAGGIGTAVGTRAGAAPAGPPPVRPPGSVPEPAFLDLCIRCGECFKVCPNNVLQPVGFDRGLESLWTPEVVADWAGCEASCNACGQVCPTGAIRAIPLEEKRVARMALAVVNKETCLPLAGRGACQLCVDECVAAGYRAMEQRLVGTQVDEHGQPIEGSGYLAPVVLADKCVGCGLCQTRCYAVNVKTEGLLDKSAIIVEAGGDREDRLMRGSYRKLRKQEAAQREEAERIRREEAGDGGYYVPGVDEPADPFGGGSSGDDPFGAGT